MNERDARMAAALALAFQSSHLEDGLAEFLTMVRGCNLIAFEGAFDEMESAFYVGLLFTLKLLFSFAGLRNRQTLTELGFSRRRTSRDHANACVRIPAEPCESR